MSWRRLGVLVRQLPAAARIHELQERETKSVPLDECEWTVTDHLIATVADHIGQAHFKKYRPIKRPGQNAGTRLGTTDQPEPVVRAYLAQFRPEVTDAERN